MIMIDTDRLPCGCMSNSFAYQRISEDCFTPQMFQNRSPRSAHFYQGRIINRFSKDMSEIDKDSALRCVEMCWGKHASSQHAPYKDYASPNYKFSMDSGFSGWHSSRVQVANQTLSKWSVVPTAVLVTIGCDLANDLHLRPRPWRTWKLHHGWR